MHGSKNSWNLIQEIEEAESINKFKEKNQILKTRNLPMPNLQILPLPTMIF